MDNNTVILIIAIVLLIVMASMFVIGWLTDKREWNGGVCPCNDVFEWESFDMDSSGAMGYKCPHCHRCIWISHSVPPRK